MEEKLISVIVPVYNVERYLEKCIESIRGQSYRHLEIVLSDDGSTDGSGACCDRYAALDSRIKVIHKENGGLSDARNAGIEIASGAYFVFIDSDDFITTDTIERMYTAAEENQCQIAVCNMIRVFEDGSTETFYQPANQPTVLHGNERFETLKQPSVCNKLFSAELFKDVRFPKGKFYEDTFVYHILAHRVENIALTGHDGYFYMSRRDSILGQAKYTDRYFDFIEAVYVRMTYLLEYQVDYYSEEACLSMYAAVSAGEKHIIKTLENAKKREQMHNWYKVAYSHLMKRSDTGVKQKVRLILLRYLPVLHNLIY